jgi:dsRNA-specific ribonuclease
MPECAPFNPVNAFVSRAFVEDLLRRYDVNDVPRDMDWYRRAFVHRSYCTRKNHNVSSGNTKCPEDCVPLQDVSYERLEFLGDSVLNNVVAAYLFDRYPNEQEGFLTHMRTQIVNGNSLAQLAEQLGLGRHAIISRHVEHAGGRTNKNILEDVFEAFVGAVFCDFSSPPGTADEGAPLPTLLQWRQEGYARAYRFTIAVIEAHIDLSEVLLRLHTDHAACAIDAKSTFIRWCQQGLQYTPRFVSKSVGLTKHTTRVVDRNGHTLAVGYGESRKDAEADAARQAIRHHT